MLLLAMIYIGFLIFIPSIYMLAKNYKLGNYIKIYGLLSYWGLFISYLGIILSMESEFKKLSGALPNLLPVFITVVVFGILHELLCKPTFLKDK